MFVEFLIEEFKSIEDQVINVRYVGIMAAIRKIMMSLQFLTTMCTYFHSSKHGGQAILCQQIILPALKWLQIKAETNPKYT